MDLCPSRSASRFYTEYLPENLTSNPKLFADDTFLFSTVTDPNATGNQTNDLLNTNTWAC